MCSDRCVNTVTIKSIIYHLIYYDYENYHKRVKKSRRSIHCVIVARKKGASTLLSLKAALVLMIQFICFTFGESSSCLV